MSARSLVALRRARGVPGAAAEAAPTSPIRASAPPTPTRVAASG